MKRSPALLQALILLLALLPGGAAATSVRSVSVGEMVSRASLIFEGRVLAVEAREGAGQSSIETCVLFEVIDLVKGEVNGNTLELCFAGGTVGARGRWVAGMVYPEEGETGIYFVEDAERPLVNPIFGWDQGRFPIRTLPGDTDRRVTVAGGSPVVGLERGEATPAPALSRGVASGVETAEESGPAPAAPTQPAPSAPGPSRSSGQIVTPGAAPGSTPLTPDAFKTIVRGLMQAPAP